MDVSPLFILHHLQFSLTYTGLRKMSENSFHIFNTYTKLIFEFHSYPFFSLSFVLNDWGRRLVLSKTGRHNSVTYKVVEGKKMLISLLLSLWLVVKFQTWHSWSTCLCEDICDPCSSDKQVASQLLDYPERWSGGICVVKNLNHTFRTSRIVRRKDSRELKIQERCISLLAAFTVPPEVSTNIIHHCLSYLLGPSNSRTVF